MSVLHMIAVWLRGLVRGRTDLATENLALRQQPAVLTVRTRRSRLRRRGQHPLGLAVSALGWLAFRVDDRSV